MTYNRIKDKAVLAELLNECESDLRELAGQEQQQRERVLKLLREHQEDKLLDLFELSSQPDYSFTHQYLSLLWSYKESGGDSLIPDEEYQQAMNTILHVSQEIIDNWPALTPKKVSRLGILIKGAAMIASKK